MSDTAERISFPKDPTIETEFGSGVLGTFIIIVGGRVMVTNVVENEVVFLVVYPHIAPSVDTTSFASSRVF